MIRPRPTSLVAAVAVALVACGSGDIGQPAVSVPPGTETISFAAEDGVELEGLLYGDDGAEAVIVLAHQRGGRKEQWNDFAVEAADEGFAAFAFDFRGYGRTQGERDTMLVEDLGAAVELVRERRFGQVFVVGASMGGTATLALAQDRQLDAVAALSPPRTFGAVAVEPAAIEEPALLVYADDDEPYSADAAAINAQLPDSEIVAYPGDDHGIALFESEPELGGYILRFFSSGARPDG